MNPLSEIFSPQDLDEGQSFAPSDWVELLRGRGLIQDQTCANIEEHCKVGRLVYVGFDPTADDLHLGNLMGLVALAWAQKCGHTPVALIGGATGMIGDPSGKSKERDLLSKEQLVSNIEGVTQTIKTILKPRPGEPSPLFFNNASWFSSFSFLDFLRDIGRYFRMGVMLSKESVKARLQSSEGLSFTEFSYQVLQAYDFAHLRRKHQVTIQMGGSDQWGNITAGIDLIVKKETLDHPHVEARRDSYGLVWPLLLRKDGRKFGKSEEGAIWLRPSKLSSYKFYQYLLQLSDEEAQDLLKKLTFIPLEKLEELFKNPQPHQLQQLLARHLLYFCRGEKELEKALLLTQTLQPGKREYQVRVEAIEALREELPIKALASSALSELNLMDLLVLLELQKSKSAAKRLIEGGGCYLNGARQSDPTRTLSMESDFLEGRWALLAAGKKDKALLELKASSF